jgi:uncharacterized membrane protein
MEGLLHPPLVHFAVVLPLVALAFQIAYMITKNEAHSVYAARILAVAAIMMVAVWYTGGLEGKEAYPLLDAEGKKELLAHKAYGMYVMITTLVIAAIKFAACKLKSGALEAGSLLLMLSLVGMVGYQGSLGGDVVYEHGGNVKTTKDLKECKAELEEAAMMSDDDEDEDEDEDEE